MLLFYIYIFFSAVLGLSLAFSISDKEHGAVNMGERVIIMLTFFILWPFLVIWFFARKA